MIEILPVEGLPWFEEGDDLAAAICAAADLQDGDIVVVAQKAISKIEGRVVTGDRSQVIASETRRVVAQRGDVTICETHHGLVCANAGVDESNIEEGMFVLLPLDPDASAERLRQRIDEITGRRIAVIVSDTFGRPWRRGQTNVALGVAGMSALVDLRGSKDALGRVLTSTEIAVADEVAGAAELVMGKAQRIPVAVVRGLSELGDPGAGADLIRSADEDLFPMGIGGREPPEAR